MTQIDSNTLNEVYSETTDHTDFHGLAQNDDEIFFPRMTLMTLSAKRRVVCNREWHELTRMLFLSTNDSN